MQEPPFKRRHGLTSSQPSTQVGELSPTRSDLWAILAEQRYALPSTQSSEDSSLHCVPCGCCQVRMLCPPGLNTPRAARRQTAANRSTEAGIVCGAEHLVSNDSTNLLSSTGCLLSLQSPNIQELSSIPGRGQVAKQPQQVTSEVRVGAVKINMVIKSL